MRIASLIDSLDIAQLNSFIRAKKDVAKQELALIHIDRLIRAFFLDMDDDGKEYQTAIKYLEAIKPTYKKSVLYKTLMKRAKNSAELLYKFYNTKGNKVAILKELRTRGFKI